MGGNDSKPQKVKYEKIDHPNFQNVEIVQSGDNKTKLIKMRVPVNGQKMIRDWENGLKAIQTYNKDSLLLPTYHSFESQGLCGTSGILNIFFDYFPYLLEQQITNRKEISKRFDENELWYLLYTITFQASQFHQDSRKLGDIRPQNIFINDEGYIKLANIYSWPNAENNYEASLLNNQVTYLSPQELTQQLQYGKNYPETDGEKSESFSIGLTLLDCILLHDFRALYNLNNYQISVNQLENAFKELQAQPLSPYLKRLVLQLCEIDPTKRISATNIVKQLNPHAEKIKNLQDFQKPAGYYASTYPTPQASSYMYSSEVTKGFPDKSPINAKPTYSYLQQVVGSPAKKSNAYEPESSNYQSQRFQFENKSNKLLGNYEQVTYQPNLGGSTSQNKYQPNELYLPNPVIQTNSTNNYSSNPVGNNYAYNYSSSYTPNNGSTASYNYTSSIDPNSYKIQNNDTNNSQNNQTQSNGHSFKHTISTYVSPAQAQASSSLPKGAEVLTYEIDPATEVQQKLEQTKNNENLDALMQGIKNNKPKQFLSLEEIDRRIQQSKQQYL